MVAEDPPQVQDSNALSDSDVLDVTQELEELAIDFITQLCRATNTSKNAVDATSSESEGSSSNKPSIHLEMADRTRTSPVTGSYSSRFITFPKRSSNASVKLAQLFKVVDSMHEAVIERVPVTKRDIYYRDVPLFKDQRIVDTIVDDVAASLKLERSDLNVRATSKGIFCGSTLSIYLSSGDIVCGNDSEASLIPVGEEVKTFNVDEDLAWVLIVEKDAVFQTLRHLNASNHPSLPGRGLLITGKGYPDMATRHLVKSLSDSLPQTIPIMALVDGDPYGLDILSVYKYGSSRLRHENNKLAARRIEWMGLLSSELAGFGIDKDALIPISQHDEKKALSMIQRSQDVMPAKWRKELVHMLHTRRKAEIEILSSPVSSTPVSSRGCALLPSSVAEDDTFQRAPLLKYLHIKITQFVNSARKQH
ncbi:DNA topoisomerase IV alpha subunit [Lentinula guzmanii]|uniref:DNA topoisomerase (ATP-hydrolyzing) n=1 Tax=Lentinula guzmanii TaxID=2804957 RepID=A0AA38JY02_9AGAR|nr:DNA topoisomerase IV alpha subunit [Lentinula guzmanii]